MNKQQRNQNRENAEMLASAARHARLMLHVCENCGEPGGHWVQMPQSLESLLGGAEPSGFWTCSKYYGEDGRRLLEHTDQRIAGRDTDAVIASIIFGLRP